MTLSKPKHATAEQKDAIRQAFTPCCQCGRHPLMKVIAARFDISITTVHRIIYGRRYV